MVAMEVQMWGIIAVAAAEEVSEADRAVRHAFEVHAQFVGAAHDYTQVPVAIDGEPVSYDGQAFGFAVQGGLRVPLGDHTHTHLLVSGAVGVYGHPVGSAAVGLAWRL